jgi:tight adherence protein B
MSPLTLFGLIALLSFAVLMFALRPSKPARDVQQRLQMIEQMPVARTTEEISSILREENLSDVPWLNDLMTQLPLFSSLQRLLLQADSPWTVGTLTSGSLALALAGGWAATFWVPALPLMLLIAAASGAAPFLYLFAKRMARFRRFEELLPDGIDLMSRALRAGHTVTSAIEMVAQEGSDPLASEFRRVFEEQNFGLPMREALLNLSHRVPLPDVNFLVTAILVQKETGGNLAEVLDKTTQVIRERFRLRGQLRVYTAQGRLTGWILAALPFIMFILLRIANPNYVEILITDPTGQKLIYVGLGMMLVGAWVIRKVIDVKV